MWMPEAVPAWWYNVFYVLAFAAGWALAWRAGRRAGLPTAEWAAVMLAAGAAGIAGSKLLFFDLSLHAPGEKTILGGVLGGLLGLLVVARWLRLGRSPLDAFSVAVPVGFATGRIGCLLAGCCYGAVTELPWGIVYGAGSPAFGAHLAAGLIDTHAGEALPVHPTQLYEAAMALGAAWFVQARRARLRAPGSTALATLALLCAGRLLVEFVRQRELPTLLGLSSVQWLLAAAAALCAIAVLRGERRPALHAAAAPYRLRVRPGGGVLAGAGAAALLVALLLPLVPVERAALLLLALPVAGSAALLSRRAAAGGFAAVSVIALPLAPLPEPVGEDTVRRGRWTFALSGGAGSVEEERWFPSGESEWGGCGPSGEWHTLLLRHQLGGAALGYEHPTGPSQAWGIRVSGFTGRREIKPQTTPSTGVVLPSGERSVSGAALSVSTDERWFGVRLGAMAGSVPGRDTVGTTALVAGLRVGPARGVHGWYSYNAVDPLPMPANTHYFGIGFGVDDGQHTLRLGLGDAGYMVGGNLRAGPSVELEPLLAFRGFERRGYRAQVTVRYGVERR